MRRFLTALPLTVLLLAPAGPGAEAQSPVVRSVLFFSPTCGHCHEVINNRLPAIFEQFGGSPEVVYDESLPPDEVAFYEVGNGTVQMLFVDVSVEAGALLFDAATTQFDIPDEMRGVPRLVVGGDYYVGSVSIPAEFPGIIEAGLESGGIDWPEIEGIEAALAAVPGLATGEDPPSTTTATTATTEAAPSTETTTAETATTTSDGSGATAQDAPTPAEVLTTEGSEVDLSDGEGLFPTGERDSVWDKFTRDTLANVVAVVVLLAMAASLVGVAALWGRGSIESGPAWLVPVLALLGAGVAAYLTYVETSDSDAVCGPVGNCNLVQDSKYAELFGFIPIGVVGLVGYAIVLGCWLVVRLAGGRPADWVSLALLGGTAAGVAFSIYLTFLEPFVIGASCAWCLASAVIVTLLWWLTAGPAQAAWRRLRLP